MFHCLEKNSKKTSEGKGRGGGGGLVRGLTDLYNTPNDPQKGLQMILDRKWSQLRLQIIPSEEKGIDWTQVSGSSCHFIAITKRSQSKILLLK